MGKLKKISIGDVFAIKVEDTNSYYFGRVLFDVKEQYDLEFDRLAYLGWYGKSVLIETYKYISESPNISTYEIVLDGKFILKKMLLEENITIIDNKPVDPKKISFPETFHRVQPEGKLFTVGELAIKTSFSSDYVDKVKVYPSLGNMYYIQLATLDYAGRRDLIEDKEDILENYFRWSDLRTLQDIRKEIYKEIGEDPNQSYYELALKHGFDLARFYK